MRGAKATTTRPVNGDNVFYGDLGDDAIEGGDGLDTVTYEGASGGVTINLATGAVAGAAGSDTLSSIESVVGTAFDDDITGGTLAAGQIEFLHGGGGGNDTITGGATGQTVVSFDGINAAVG